MEAFARPRAIIFDTFGSVVDWRGSLIADLAAYGARHGITADWAGLVDDWRAAYHPDMDRVRKGELPWTRLDDLHRGSLDRLVAEHGIAGLSEADLQHINLGWHRLKPWPDTVAGLTRLKWPSEPAMHSRSSDSVKKRSRSSSACCRLKKSRRT